MTYIISYIINIY